MSTTATGSLRERFVAAFPKSQALHDQATTIFPSGVTHDLRYLEPFPIFIDYAQGAHKWDIDDHQFIDYWCGHGAMLLGHSHPAVVKAIQEQAARMTHAGGNHEGESTWGRWVQRLIPTAERVRFTGSGTEATLMALRLARIATGKPRTLKFAGHFHGWHDYVAPGTDPPFDGATPLGIADGVAEQTVIIPPNDPDLLEKTLANDPSIGAVILEPTGGRWGVVPIRGEFLEAVRDLTTKYEQILIFDEVITGFRVSPGGAQAYYGVYPDLTTLAKILAGGLPGGCVAGRADLLAPIEFRPGKPKMRHPGTYNANPLSAAAGCAALEQVNLGVPCSQANSMARLLRNQLNALFKDRGWPWLAYGDFSMFRLLPDYHGPRPSNDAEADDDGPLPYDNDAAMIDAHQPHITHHDFRQALLLQGVDMPGFGGWLSAAHTEADIARTLTAVATAIEELYPSV